MAAKDALFQAAAAAAPRKFCTPDIVSITGRKLTTREVAARLAIAERRGFIRVVEVLRHNDTAQKIYERA